MEQKDCYLQGLVEPLEIKAVVTLQEDVEVPPMPDIQVPERYRVHISATSSIDTFCSSGIGCPNLRVSLWEDILSMAPVSKE